MTDEQINDLLGAAARQQMAGAFDQASAAYLTVLRHRPDHAGATHYLGLAIHQRGRGEEGLALLRRSVALAPDSAPFATNLGLALRQRDDPHAAIDTLRQATSIDPNFGPAWTSLSAALLEVDRFDDAVTAGERAVVVAPRHPDAHVALGDALAFVERLKDARDAYLAALQLEPAHLRAWVGLGDALADDHQLADAIDAYRQALAIRPSAATATTIRARITFTESRAAPLRHGPVAGTTLMIKPDPADVRALRGIELLLNGEFRQGWAQYDWRCRSKRFTTGSRRGVPQPRWAGEPLAGRTILLHAEQGLGDAIQFVRYAPLVARAGGRVLLECRPELVALLRTVAGVDRVIALGDDLPPFDVQCPLMSLPHIMRTTLATVPAAVPYLGTDPASVGRWREAIGAASVAGAGTRQVGLVWAGSPVHANDRNRSLPLAALAPLGDVSNVRWISLQKGDAAGQLLSASFPIDDFGARITDWNDTAAIVSQLDLVIAVDTSVAHLAGALGRPVWTLLSTPAEWRWMLERDDSPWYPTMRLFRQERQGEWASLVDQVRAALVRNDR